MAGKINSKKKGSRGELELVNLLKEFGLEAHRSQQFAGKTGEAADVICKELDQFHIEVKRTETLSLYKAYDQVERDLNGADKTGLIFHRRSNKPWVVIIDARKFLSLLKCILQ